MRIFTKHGCPKCVSVKDAFRRKDIQFEEINIEESTGFKYMAFLISKGIKTMPVIELDDNSLIFKEDEINKYLAVIEFQDDENDIPYNEETGEYSDEV